MNGGILIQPYDRHGGTVGAWSNGDYLRVLLALLSTSLHIHGLKELFKTFVTIAISNT